MKHFRLKSTEANTVKVDIVVAAYNEKHARLIALKSEDKSVVDKKLVTCEVIYG